MLSVVSLFGLMAPTRAETIALTNTLIKGSGDTIYWHHSDGKRYVFPNAATYFTWYTDFKDVITLDDSQLGTIPLAANVTAKPGAKLIKVQTDPKVYAVSRYGMLHWVKTEAIANQLYGSTWNKQIIDVPDTFFTNYDIGVPLEAAIEFNPTNEQTVVPNPSYDIPTHRDFYGTISVTTNSAVVKVGSNIIVTATANNPSVLPQNARIELYDNGTAIYTCTGKLICSQALVAWTAGTHTYSARIFNEYGRHIETTTKASVRIDP